MTASNVASSPNYDLHGYSMAFGFAAGFQLSFYNTTILDSRLYKSLESYILLLTKVVYIFYVQ